MMALVTRVLWLIFDIVHCAWRILSEQVFLFEEQMERQEREKERGSPELLVVSWFLIPLITIRMISEDYLDY